ncbi:MAG: T9SS type A sorting domain-containing protein [Ignavibacteria bacterium]|nr:T9SS type A sorting domain-containing protein [Ignavibacteria bacterium]
MSAVGRIGTNFNVAVMGVDLESVRPSANSPAGSPVYRFINGAMKFVDEIPTGIQNTVNSVPEVYSLSQNYPNPFNPVTQLEFGISKLGFVSLKVYDLLGKEVAVLVNEKLSPGIYKATFNGSNFASGVYFVRMESGDFRDIKRMVLIK